MADTLRATEARAGAARAALVAADEDLVAAARLLDGAGPGGAASTAGHGRDGEAPRPAAPGPPAEVSPARAGADPPAGHEVAARLEDAAERLRRLADQG